MSRWAGRPGGGKRNPQSWASRGRRHLGSRQALLAEAEGGRRGEPEPERPPAQQPPYSAPGRGHETGVTLKDEGAGQGQCLLKGCLFRWTLASRPALPMISPPSPSPAKPGSVGPRHPLAPSIHKLAAPLCLERDSS